MKKCFGAKWIKRQILPLMLDEDFGFSERWQLQ